MLGQQAQLPTSMACTPSSEGAKVCPRPPPPPPPRAASYVGRTSCPPLACLPALCSMTSLLWRCSANAITAAGVKVGVVTHRKGGEGTELRGASRCQALREQRKTRPTDQWWADVNMLSKHA